MMTTRLLPEEEWPRLKGTELESVWPILQGENAKVIVVEEGEGASAKIVGTWAVYPMIHCEGVWIDESHRGKAGVARRLIAAMKEEVTKFGARGMITAAINDEVAKMINALGGVEIPGRAFVVSVEDRPENREVPPCPQ